MSDSCLASIKHYNVVVQKCEYDLFSNTFVIEQDRTFERIIVRNDPTPVATQKGKKSKGQAAPKKGALVE